MADISHFFCHTFAVLSILTFFLLGSFISISVIDPVPVTTRERSIKAPSNPPGWDGHIKRF